MIAPNAATAASRSEHPAPRPMRLISFKPVRKNSLRGFCSVELPIGLRIDDISIHVSHGRTWASLPAKPMLDAEGRQKRDANGKAAYSAMLQWRDRELADRFSERVVELVRQSHPGAIDEGDAA
jgi:hypothetical protein